MAGEQEAELDIDMLLAAGNRLAEIVMEHDSWAYRSRDVQISLDAWRSASRPIRRPEPPPAP